MVAYRQRIDSAMQWILKDLHREYFLSIFDYPSIANRAELRIYNHKIIHMFLSLMQIVQSFKICLAVWLSSSQKLSLSLCLLHLLFVLHQSYFVHFMLEIWSDIVILPISFDEFQIVFVIIIVIINSFIHFFSRFLPFFLHILLLLHHLSSYTNHTRSHLARNPFICDCNLRWLADYLHKNPIETSGARCDAPKRMHRRRIEALRDEKFKCKYLQY